MNSVESIGGRFESRTTPRCFENHGLAPEQAFQAFLHYGYVPSPVRARSYWENVIFPALSLPHKRSTLPSLIAEGADVLRKVVRQAVEAHGDRLHVVPLSGGLDSRAIFSALLEVVPKERILTVTFGLPGSWDFDIGKEVAKAYRVKNIEINLASPEWSWANRDVYKNIVNNAPPIWLFEAYVNSYLPALLGADKVYWSGYLGDTLTGSKLNKHESATWESARIKFYMKNRFSKSRNLGDSDFDPIGILPDRPYCDSSVLSYDEQLDIMFRQQSLIQHIIIPHGYDYVSPLAHVDWIKFLLSIPKSLRKKQFIYKEILKYAYPGPFSLPTKNLWGLPLTANRGAILLRIVRNKIEDVLGLPGERKKKDINYVDFRYTMNNDSEFCSLIRTQLETVVRCGIVPWVNPMELWSAHNNNGKNYTNELLILAGLGLYVENTGMENFSTQMGRF